jgi:hypothetical protein
MNFSRLHLVLIKSKLDQLNDAQPLKSFSDTMGHIQSTRISRLYFETYIFLF